MTRSGESGDRRQMRSWMTKSQEVDSRDEAMHIVTSYIVFLLYALRAHQFDHVNISKAQNHKTAGNSCQRMAIHNRMHCLFCRTTTTGWVGVLVPLERFAATSSDSFKFYHRRQGQSKPGENIVASQCYHLANKYKLLPSH